MFLPTQPAPEKKPEDIIVAEKNVPIEWHVGDIILDTYEVCDIFTTGGMGNVYRVHHRGWADFSLACSCSHGPCMAELRCRL